MTLFLPIFVLTLLCLYMWILYHHVLSFSNSMTDSRRVSDKNATRWKVAREKLSSKLEIQKQFVPKRNSQAHNIKDIIAAVKEQIAIEEKEVRCLH